MKFIYIKSITALVLFLVQYMALAYLLFSGPLFPQKWYTWMFYIPGMILGFWSIFTMGAGNINAAPDILPAARFVSTGPYQVIRHPMYAALLLVFIPLVYTSATPVRIIIMIILLVNLLVKIGYEERRLSESFSKYTEYSSKTWRLIPFVF